MKTFLIPRCALLTAIGFTVSLSINGASARGDWPQWRGPNRDGLSSDRGLLKQWPAGGPRLVWEARGPGSGYATASVAGDRVFVMGDQGPTSYLIALRRTDGQRLWMQRVGKSGAPGWGDYAGPRCTPTVDAGRVFAVGQYGEVLCAEAASGAEIWPRTTPRISAARWRSGACGMPLVAGDMVILIPGGRQGDLVALNKQSGELIWRSKDLTDSVHYSSPILAEIGGVAQIIQLTNASVAGIRVSDGQLLWRVARRNLPWSAVVPTPIYSEGRVYVSSGYGTGCNLYKISAEQGKFAAVESYANKVMTNHHGGVVLVGQYLYGFSDGKGWTCQDLQSGNAVWRQQGKIGKGSLVYADGLLYLRAESGKGTVAIIEASPEGYRELGRFDPPDRSDANSCPIRS